MGITPEQLAMVAARALTPKAPPTVGLDAPARAAGQRPRAGRAARRPAAPRPHVDLPRLVADADETLVIVARFLALLELFQEGAIAFEQAGGAGRAHGPLDRQRRRARSTSSDEFDEPSRRLRPGRRRPMSVTGPEDADR